MYINPGQPEPKLIAQAVDIARSGAVIVFPTDTVYGVGVAAGPGFTPEALFELKGRDRDKAIPWLVSDVRALERYGEELPAYAFELARRHWPGALTLVVRASASVPLAFVARDGSIALRAPSNPIALALLAALGAPLATTSANRQGDAPATSLASLDPRLMDVTPAHAVQPAHATPVPVVPPVTAVLTAGSALVPTPATVALVIDGGPTPGAVPSTIVSCLDDEPRVLREGSFPSALLLH
jgi:L-threonylcarbamoyladenylate synthase